MREKEPTGAEIDPIYRMAEEAQKELQRQADEAQEAIERAGVPDLRDWGSVIA